VHGLLRNMVPQALVSARPGILEGGDRRSPNSRLPLIFLTSVERRFCDFAQIWAKFPLETTTFATVLKTSGEGVTLKIADSQLPFTGAVWSSRTITLFRRTGTPPVTASVTMSRFFSEDFLSMAQCLANSWICHDRLSRYFPGVGPPV
jgi:hypothetical protein